jgi:glucose/arabinose dehydrogenase
MNPGDAVARADGVAQAPDGSLYITDSQKGRVWRVVYKGTK